MSCLCAATIGIRRRALPPSTPPSFFSFLQRLLFRALFRSVETRLVSFSSFHSLLFVVLDIQSWSLPTNCLFDNLSIAILRLFHSSGSSFHIQNVQPSNNTAFVLSLRPRQCWLRWHVLFQGLLARRPRGRPYSTTISGQILWSYTPSQSPRSGPSSRTHCWPRQTSPDDVYLQWQLYVQSLLTPCLDGAPWV